MKEKILKLINLIVSPIIKEPILFTFLYLMGVVSLYLIPEIPYIPYYIKLYGELFLDTYLVCVLVSVMPKRIHATVLGIVYLIAYLLTLVDTFCFVKFGTFISPTIIQLIYETNMNEASGFFSSYIDSGIFLSPVGVVILLFCLNLSTIYFCQNKIKIQKQFVNLIIIILLFIGVFCSAKNITYITRLYKLRTISSIEHYMGNEYWVKKTLYNPFYRFCFAIHTNNLSQAQMIQYARKTNSIIIDSCKFTTPNIIVIIGESYNKYHSELYGYNRPTTPYQKEWNENGKIIVFNNMISPFNITSNVFKNLFSLNDLSKNEAWDEKPLFTQLFKKAGYDVTFYTNQYVQSSNEEIAQFSGSVFLNNPELSKSQFTNRNTKMFTYDEELINDFFSKYKNLKGKNNLIILHLIGQHVDYKNRYPKKFRAFNTSDYKRPELSKEDKTILSDYDNAILYNDYVLKTIVDKFTEQNAIIIYLSDHGEECYDQDKIFGRTHGEITKKVAKYEYEVPFWIYTTERFKKENSQIYNQIVLSKNKPGSINDLGHMLLYIGGVYCPYFNESNNILSPDYNIKKKRLLRNSVDYDKLMFTK